MWFSCRSWNNNMYKSQHSRYDFFSYFRTKYTLQWSFVDWNIHGKMLRNRNFLFFWLKRWFRSRNFKRNIDDSIECDSKSETTSKTKRHGCHFDVLTNRHGQTVGIRVFPPLGKAHFLASVYIVITEIVIKTAFHHNEINSSIDYLVLTHLECFSG